MKRIYTKTDLKETFEKLIEDTELIIMQDDYDGIVDALEKQIAKAPKNMNTPILGEKFWWYCGHCGASRHTSSKSNYCSYCGGKVEWE